MKVQIVLLFVLAMVCAEELKFKYFIFQEKCFNTFFVDFDFFNLHCLKYTVSKTLGYGLVYGSPLVKAPQLYKIFTAKSVFGVSFNSVLLQAFMNNILISYNLNKNNPFSIYGENVFLGISNIVIILGFFMFSSANLKSHVCGFIFLVGISIPFLLQTMPSKIYDNTLIICMLIFVFSRFAQILEIFKNKTTGNLSFLTSLLNFLGMVIRLFTVYTEVRQNILYLISNTIPVVVNGFIVLQFFIYWNSKTEVGEMDSKNSIGFKSIQEQDEKLFEKYIEGNMKETQTKISNHPTSILFYLKESKQNVLPAH